METLIVNIDNSDNVQIFLKLIRKLDFVKSVKTTSSIVDREKMQTIESSEVYSWIAPNRPATEKEIDELISEMNVEEEQGKYYSAVEGKTMTLQKLVEWQKTQK